MTRLDRAERSASARAGEARGGWRSHTFADGVRSLTLVGPLDVALAGRLWSRIAELLTRGARRLIIDASAIEPAGEEPALLAAVLAGHRSSCQVVVIVPAGSSLTDLLPTSVGVALTLTDAHRQLACGVIRHARRAPAVPGGRLTAVERRTLSIRQAIRWAQRAAREGEYERALGWLDVIERTEGQLPLVWR